MAPLYNEQNTLRLKIAFAKARIQEAVDLVGIQNVYAAFSGGKDSQAVLRLCRDLYPSMLAIHNCHEGESIDPSVPGVLSIRPPKATTVPEFFKTVKLLGQIDGTRRDEDKTVIFNGKEIHRSEMPNWYTTNGVFNLYCCFPLMDWTEADVYEYLEMTNPPFFTSGKYSYEGEGDFIGTKTFFCQYGTAKEGERVMTTEDLETACQNVPNLYLTCAKLSPALGAVVASLSSLNKKITVEVGADKWFDLQVPNVHYFLVTDTLPYLLYPIMFPVEKNIFIKIRVLNETEFDSKLDLANIWAVEGHQVLLMTEYSLSKAWLAGEQMKKSFDRIHNNVRILHPMQQLLGID